jgi:glycerol uptake facilitator-like aquaporin
MSDAIDVDPQKLVAEVVGIFAFIFIGAGSVIVTGGTNLVGSAIAYGLAIALLVSALGHVSSALFNPALTIGLWVTRQMDTANTVAYIIPEEPVPDEPDLAEAEGTVPA